MDDISRINLMSTDLDKYVHETFLQLSSRPEAEQHTLVVPDICHIIKAGNAAVDFRHIQKRLRGIKPYGAIVERHLKKEFENRRKTTGLGQIGCGDRQLREGNHATIMSSDNNDGMSGNGLITHPTGLMGNATAPSDDAISSKSGGLPTGSNGFQNGSNGVSSGISCPNGGPSGGAATAIGMTYTGMRSAAMDFGLNAAMMTTTVTNLHGQEMKTTAKTITPSAFRNEGVVKDELMMQAPTAAATATPKGATLNTTGNIVNPLMFGHVAGTQPLNPHGLSRRIAGTPLPAANVIGNPNHQNLVMQKSPGAPDRRNRPGHELSSPPDTNRQNLNACGNPNRPGNPNFNGNLNFPNATNSPGQSQRTLSPSSNNAEVDAQGNRTRVNPNGNTAGLPPNGLGNAANIWNITRGKSASADSTTSNLSSLGMSVKSSGITKTRQPPSGKKSLGDKAMKVRKAMKTSQRNIPLTAKVRMELEAQKSMDLKNDIDRILGAEEKFLDGGTAKEILKNVNTTKKNGKVGNETAVNMLTALNGLTSINGVQYDDQTKTVINNDTDFSMFVPGHLNETMMNFGNNSAINFDFGTGTINNFGGNETIVSKGPQKKEGLKSTQWSKQLYPSVRTGKDDDAIVAKIRQESLDPIVLQELTNRKKEIKDLRQKILKFKLQSDDLLADGKKTSLNKKKKITELKREIALETSLVGGIIDVDGGIIDEANIESSIITTATGSQYKKSNLDILIREDTDKTNFLGKKYYRPGLADVSHCLPEDIEESKLNRKKKKELRAKKNAKKDADIDGSATAVLNSAVNIDGGNQTAMKPSLLKGSQTGMNGNQTDMKGNDTAITFDDDDLLFGMGSVINDLNVTAENLSSNDKNASVTNVNTLGYSLAHTAVNFQNGSAVNLDGNQTVFNSNLDGNQTVNNLDENLDSLNEIPYTMLNHHTRSIKLIRTEEEFSGLRGVSYSNQNAKSGPVWIVSHVQGGGKRKERKEIRQPFVIKQFENRDDPIEDRERLAKKRALDAALSFKSELLELKHQYTQELITAHHISGNLDAFLKNERGGLLRKPAIRQSGYPGVVWSGTVDVKEKWGIKEAQKKTGKNAKKSTDDLSSSALLPPVAEEEGNCTSSSKGWSASLHVSTKVYSRFFGLALDKDEYDVERIEAEIERTRLEAIQWRQEMEKRHLRFLYRLDMPKEYFKTEGKDGGEEKIKKDPIRQRLAEMERKHREKEDAIAESFDDHVVEFDRKVLKSKKKGSRNGLDNMWSKGNKVWSDRSDDAGENADSKDSMDDDAELTKKRKRARHIRWVWEDPHLQRIRCTEKGRILPIDKGYFLAAVTVKGERVLEERFYPEIDLEDRLLAGLMKKGSEVNYTRLPSFQPLSGSKNPIMPILTDSEDQQTHHALEDSLMTGNNMSDNTMSGNNMSGNAMTSGLLGCGNGMASSISSNAGDTVASNTSTIVAVSDTKNDPNNVAMALLQQKPHIHSEVLKIALQSNPEIMSTACYTAGEIDKARRKALDRVFQVKKIYSWCPEKKEKEKAKAKEYHISKKREKLLLAALEDLDKELKTELQAESFEKKEEKRQQKEEEKTRKLSEKERKRSEKEEKKKTAAERRSQRLKGTLQKVEVDSSEEEDDLLTDEALKNQVQRFTPEEFAILRQQEEQEYYDNLRENLQQEEADAEIEETRINLLRSAQNLNMEKPQFQFGTDMEVPRGLKVEDVQQELEGLGFKVDAKKTEMIGKYQRQESPQVEDREMEDSDVDASMEAEQQENANRNATPGQDTTAADDENALVDTSSVDSSTIIPYEDPLANRARIYAPLRNTKNPVTGAMNVPIGAMLKDVNPIIQRLTLNLTRNKRGVKEQSAEEEEIEAEIEVEPTDMDGSKATKENQESCVEAQPLLAVGNTRNSSNNGATVALDQHSKMVAKRGKHSRLPKDKIANTKLNVFHIADKIIASKKKPVFYSKLTAKEKLQESKARLAKRLEQLKGVNTDVPSGDSSSPNHLSNAEFLSSSNYSGVSVGATQTLSVRDSDDASIELLQAYNIKGRGSSSNSGDSSLIWGDLPTINEGEDEELLLEDENDVTIVLAEDAKKKTSFDLLKKSIDKNSVVEWNGEGGQNFTDGIEEDVEEDGNGDIVFHYRQKNDMTKIEMLEMRRERIRDKGGIQNKNFRFHKQKEVLRPEMQLTFNAEAQINEDMREMGMIQENEIQRSSKFYAPSRLGLKRSWMTPSAAQIRQADRVFSRADKAEREAEKAERDKKAEREAERNMGIKKVERSMEKMRERAGVSTSIKDIYGNLPEGEIEKPSTLRQRKYHQIPSYNEISADGETFIKTEGFTMRVDGSISTIAGSSGASSSSSKPGNSGDDNHSNTSIVNSDQFVVKKEEAANLVKNHRWQYDRVHQKESTIIDVDEEGVPVFEVSNREKLDGEWTTYKVGNQTFRKRYNKDERNDGRKKRKM